MAFAERRESDTPDEPRTLDPALAGTGGIQMNSFGFWQQGLAPGSWSQQVLARNLDGEDFTGYRRASDPSHLRDSGTHLPDVGDIRPEDIVVENACLVSGQAADGTLAAIGRLVAAIGGESARDEIDAETLVQPVRSDLYEIELVDTVADASRRAGLDGSPLLAPVRGGAATQTPVDEDGLDALGLSRSFRRTTDQECLPEAFKWMCSAGP